MGCADWAARGLKEPRIVLEGSPLEVIIALKEQIVRERMRDPRLALRWAKQAKYVASFLPPDSEGKALAWWAMGNARYSFCQYNRVLACYRKAERWYAERGRQLELGRLLANQVAILQEKGEVEAGLTLAAVARTIFEALGDEALPYLAGLLINLVSAYYQTGDMQAAEDAYRQARQLFETVGNPGEAARLDINWANVLCDKDRFSEVGELLERARATLIEEQLWLEVTRADLNLGILAYRLGEYEEALSWLDQARRGFEDAANRVEVAVVAMYRSFVYLHLNLLKESLHLSTQAIECFKQNDKMLRQLSQTFMHQALAYQRKRTGAGYKRANKSLKWARRLLHCQGADSRILLLKLDYAELALDRYELDRDRRWLLKARQLLKRVKRELVPDTWPAYAARALLLRARCALYKRLPRWNQVRRLAQKALGLATRFRLPDVTILAYPLLARVAEAEGELEAALAYCQKAIELIESLRAQFPLDEFQAGFMDDKLPIYKQAVRLSQRLSDDPRVLHYLTLSSLLTLPRAWPPPSAIPEKLQALRRKMHWLQSKESVLTEGEMAHLRALEEEIAEEWRRWLLQFPRRPHEGGHPGLARLAPEQAPQLVAALQERLTPTQALLHFYEVEGQPWVALVRENRFTCLALKSSESNPLTVIEKKLASWVGLSNTVFEVKELPPLFLQRGLMYLRFFYDVLIAPLERHPGALGGVDELFVVLPPAWHTLPVAAFFDGERYLVQRYCLTHLSSPDALLAQPSVSQRRDEAAPRRALVVGYSNKGRQPYLEYAPQEAEAVAMVLLPSSDVSLLREEAATCEEVRQMSQQSDLVHLATHACFRPDNPLFSWIQLADGYLTVSELYGMALLRKPLVVLSACETGRGWSRGGGLLGMSRGWLAAGATGLVVSLWKVEDQATARLMENFYEGLARDRVPSHSAARALQRAQCAAIEDIHDGRAPIARHPFSWGAFLFIGG